MFILFLTINQDKILIKNDFFAAVSVEQDQRKE